MFYKSNNKTYPIEYGDEVILRTAENQSPWSNPELFGQVSYLRPKKALDAIIVYSLLLEDHYWKTDSAIRHLGNLAFKYKYEGEWGILQRFLEETTNTQEFESLMLEIKYNKNDIYGNFKKSQDRWRKTRLEKVPSVGLDKDKTVKKVFRRGYDDKGTLRPSHKPPLPGGEAIERIDRRKNINHPLLKQESEVFMRKKPGDRDARNLVRFEREVKIE